MNGAVQSAAPSEAPAAAASAEAKPLAIYGLPWYYFAVVAVVVVSATYLGKLPAGMVGAFPIMIILGVVFNAAG